MMNENPELAALRTLAASVAERLSVEILRRMDLGHGRTDADAEDLAALIALQQDASDAREVVCALHRHQPPQREDR